MKKLLFALSITTAMVSCSSDETIDVVARLPITFGNAFVDNSTRAATDHTYGGGTADENILKKFNVYGTVTGNKNTVNIFNGDDVTLTKNDEGETWDCTKTQYWVPNCDYHFIALVDATAEKEVTVTETNGETTTTTTETAKNSINTDGNGMPTSITYDVRTQADLLFAQETKKTSDDTSKMDEVDFTFSHLLSKVMFTFQNNFPADSGVELTVKGITITNAVSKNSYSTDNGKWSWADVAESELKESLSFGDTGTMAPGGSSSSSREECGNVCLLIPYDYKDTNKIKISFEVHHNKGGNPTPMTPEVELELEPGCSYNLTAELIPENVKGVVPITFTIVSDKTWDNSGDGDHGVDYSKDPFQ